MSKRFIYSINYMRGICMLGVIGIHVGSVALTMPSPNLTLTAILEILSRFSVPAFFFLSAFGMFYSQPLAAPFSYGSYLKRRLKTVLIPYLTWSLFYMTYISYFSHNWSVFQPWQLFRTLWYGLGMYHIYFLVILLWFYFFMPFWRVLLRWMEKSPRLTFTALFIGNLIFNFYSSYIWNYHFENPLLQDAFTYRLNYVVLHYIFIFMFGAYTAEHFDAMKDWIACHGTCINLLEAVSIAAMLGAYYGVMSYLQYDALSAVFTVHQLSPVGMVYTLSTMLFFLYWWECRPVPTVIQKVFTVLGNFSYPIYLVHPLFLGIITAATTHYHIYLRSLYIIAIYVIVVLLAVAFSYGIKKANLPHWLRICIEGK